jgi:hypothetical protein
MKTPACFHALCSGLHQDALFLVDGSIERLAEGCLGHVPRSEHPGLRAFLSDALKKHTPADLKGLINREKSDVRLDSAASKLFLEAVLMRL